MKDLMEEEKGEKRLGREIMDLIIKIDEKKKKIV